MCTDFSSSKLFTRDSMFYFQLEPLSKPKGLSVEEEFVKNLQDSLVRDMPTMRELLGLEA